jgi:hypothetical protein
MNAGNRRTREQSAELAERIIARKRADPDLTANQLAERLGTTHVVVLKVLRGVGLAKAPVKRAVRR